MRCSRNILLAGMRVAALCTVIVAIAVPAISEDETIRIGMIGLDTSHATDFTAILNEGQVAGARVVAGVKQFSPDIEYSATNVDKYVELLTTKYGLELYDSVEDMLPHVDGVMVESVDGRPHLAQAKPAIEAGKLVFVDKPMAASLADVIEMFQLARKHHTQVWSASNLRYHPGVVAARDADIGELVSVFSHGPAPVEEHHPDLMWYGIHPVEAMFTVMGTGCETVQRTHTAGTDLITGTWQDGRIGFVMGMRLNAGIDTEELAIRYPDAWRGFAPALAWGAETRLIERDGVTLRLTKRGRRLANELFIRVFDPSLIED